MKHTLYQIISVSFLFFLCSSCNKEGTKIGNELITPDVILGPPLPLMKIQTGNQNIVDEPKIPGSLQIYQEELLVEEHLIGIEIRGSSSQMFDKKSYGFETWDEMGEDLNASLGGFPEEEDWILYGPYSDKSLVRNVLIYELSNNMGQYASKTKFYELEINEIFQGTYVLMEKIKRDRNRVDISKNKVEDITGGYIIKIDKPTGDGDWYDENIAFASQYNTTGLLVDRGNINFLYEYPKADDVSDEQKKYIQDYIHLFETALISEDFESIENGYRQFIDLDSFIDFFILNEFSKNPDGFRLSTYLHKEKGGKLKMGPIWDFNLAFGNVNYCEGDSPYGWAHRFNDICSGDNWQVPFWWNRFLDDPEYVSLLKERWAILRSEILSSDTVSGRLRELQDNLKGSSAIDKNFGKWLILGKYIWPNKFIGNSYDSEINYLEEWINERFDWLDQNINEL
ncbi:CotH kinase family protein [Flavobacteriaceae bacterium]|nr:CotH kinase family protein [Flavobacteriaceae bacterium]